MTKPTDPKKILEKELRRVAKSAEQAAVTPNKPVTVAPMEPTTKETSEKPIRRGPGRPRKTEAEKKAAAEKRAAAKKEKAAKKTGGAEQAAPAPKPVKADVAPENEKNLIYALDIGTRSVIGIVAEEQPDGLLKIVATERQEHRTRAMLDGQIHDVPQVAAVIRQVTEALEAKVGHLRSAAVAAAGRALYTMTATAEKEFHGVISAAAERDLDFSGVQAAQAKLAASHTVDDPTHYYCVGYSTIRYELDGIPLKSLVGQRGDQAKAEVIATFLPRQVIDSMQSALTACGLEMRALTLEPIAAINVLIPPTMRHLNLVLVDIGAGTSDVAITKNGSVIAYGMVPKAGDEITEAISQNFLLDFNVAEAAKRSAAEGEDVAFSDILGASYELAAADVIKPVLPSVRDLAGSIATEIMRLNSEAPQAVMLVGGGSLTPMLRDYVAEALEMPENRVAVRHPDKVAGVADLPDALHSPDAVTPLGILKIASMNTLHFLRVHVNGQEHSLFNFRTLTVSDALLASGINLRKWNGRPGLALMVTVDGKNKSYPGTMGTLANILVDGAPGGLDTPVQDGSDITVTRGENGVSPSVRVRDALAVPPALAITLNDAPVSIPADILVNGEKAEPDQPLRDGDEITSHMAATVGEALRAAGCPPQGRRIHYTLNGDDTSYVSTPTIKINDLSASLSLPVHPGDRLTYEEGALPTLGAALHISELDASLVLYYQGEEHKIPSASLVLEKNGAKATPETQLTEGCTIRYEKSERRATTVSDALAAVGFEPPAATSRVSAQLLVNGRAVDFTAPVKNGDTLDVKLTPLASPVKSFAPSATQTEVPTPAPAASPVRSSQPTSSTPPTSAPHFHGTGLLASNFQGSQIASPAASSVGSSVVPATTTTTTTTTTAMPQGSATTATTDASAGATPNTTPHHGLNSLAEALGLSAADVAPTPQPAPGTSNPGEKKKPAISIADLMRND